MRSTKDLIDIVNETRLPPVNANGRSSGRPLREIEDSENNYNFTRKATKNYQTEARSSNNSTAM